MAAKASRGARSLTFRVLLLASLWSMLALVVIALVISTLYRRSAETSFRDLLRAQLNNVINSVSTDENFQLTGTPQLGDLRFSQPQTGWYWIVEPIGDNFPSEPMSSTSLGYGSIPIPDTELIWDFYFRLFTQRQTSIGRLLLGTDRIGQDCYQAIYTRLGVARSIPSPPTPSQSFPPTAAGSISPATARACRRSTGSRLKIWWRRRSRLRFPRGEVYSQACSRPACNRNSDMVAERR